MTTGTIDSATGTQIVSTDAAGNQTTNSYDVDGRLLQSKVEWNDNGTLRTLSIHKVTGYNQFGQILAEADYDATGTTIVGGQMTYEYDSHGRMETATQILVTGNYNPTNPNFSAPLVTGYTYYNDGALQTVTAPDGSTTDYFYDPRFNTADPQGNANTTQQAWSAKSGVFRSTGNTTEQITHTLTDKGGRTVEITDQLTNAVTVNNYDAYDRLIASTEKDVNLGYISDSATTDRADITMTYVYDGVGNRVATYAPGLAPVFSRYDTSDRLIQEFVNAPHGAETNYAYSPNGNVTQATEKRWSPTSVDPATGIATHGTGPEVFTTTRQYDVFDELTETNLDPATTGSSDGLRQTKYQYDDAGNLTQVDLYDITNPAAPTLKAQTASVADAFGRTRKITNTDGSVLTIDYDLAGHKTAETLTKPEVTVAGVLIPVVNRRTEYVYDGLGRLRETREMTFNGTTYDLARSHMVDYVLANGTTTITNTEPGPNGIEVTVIVLDAVGNKEKITLSNLYEVHHLLVQRLFDPQKSPKFAKFFDDIGILRDASKNSSLLPTPKALKAGDDVGEAALHRGRHIRSYDELVETPVAKLMEDFNAGLLTKEQARSAVHGLQAKLRSGLQNGTIKLHHFDTTTNRKEWLQQAVVTFVALGVWSGLSEAEAQEAAMKEVERMVDNESYYREKNAFVRYGQAGFYTSDSNSDVARWATFAIDFFNPVEDVAFVTDVLEDGTHAINNHLVRPLNNVVENSLNDIGNSIRTIRTERSALWNMRNDPTLLPPRAPTQSAKSRSWWWPF